MYIYTRASERKNQVEFEMFDAPPKLPQGDNHSELCMMCVVRKPMLQRLKQLRPCERLQPKCAQLKTPKCRIDSVKKVMVRKWRLKSLIKPLFI